MSKAFPRPEVWPAAKAKPTTDDMTSSSAERSLRVLAQVAREGRPIALTDLAMELGLPKGTAHRICTQLMSAGYLVRDVEGKSLTVGPALRRLAFDALNHGVLRGARHEVLASLVSEVNETCNFTTLDGSRVLYLDRVEAHWPLRLTLETGSQVPLHCTASGKLFLASMERRSRDAMIDRLELARMTPRTLTSAGALREECDQIRRDGYSCDREEYIAGLIAVAVPVVDSTGATRAAIAVHAPSARMSLEQALACLGALKAAAERMRSLL